MEKQETAQIGGIIERKDNKEKGPQGDFIVNSMKFTCWSETYWDKFDEGDEVIIQYTDKQNQYNGRTYTNHNITKMYFKNEPEPAFTTSMKETLQSDGIKVDKLSGPMPILKSDNLKFKLGGIYYRVKSIELELIEN
jgi:hypothetical protein